MHIQCIQVYELIKKLQLNSKKFNTHTHTHTCIYIYIYILWIRTLWNWIYEYAIYEIIWICEYMKLYNLHTIMNVHIYGFIHAHVQCI